MKQHEKIIRALIREQIKDIESKKLRVLDFDDTLAHTTERVRVETPGTKPGYKMISSEEFAVYDLQKGEYFDPEVAFLEFDEVDVERAKPVPLVSDIFTKIVNAPGERKILILTARDSAVEPFVMKFVEQKLGVKDPRSKVDFVGVGSKDPLDKVRIIKKYLQDDPTIDFVSFYDDSGKNVQAVKRFIEKINFKRDKKIKTDIRQVITNDEGETQLIKLVDDD